MKVEESVDLNKVSADRPASDGQLSTATFTCPHRLPALLRLTSSSLLCTSSAML